jgi:hypothetical protein
MKKLFILLSFVTLNFACATMSDVVKNKSNGTTQVYSVSENDAYKIARQVFRWEGSDAIEERKEENLLLTSSSAGLFTMGTFMGVWLEPVDTNNTKVTVVTKRKVATNAVTSLTEGTFHKRFAQAVAILKSGNPLPVDAP